MPLPTPSPRSHNHSSQVASTTPSVSTEEALDNATGTDVADAQDARVWREGGRLVFPSPKKQDMFDEQVKNHMEETQRAEKEDAKWGRAQVCGSDHYEECTGLSDIVLIYVVTVRCNIDKPGAAVSPGSSSRRTVLSVSALLSAIATYCTEIMAPVQYSHFNPRYVIALRSSDSLYGSVQSIHTYWVSSLEAIHH